MLFDYRKKFTDYIHLSRDPYRHLHCNHPPRHCLLHLSKQKNQVSFIVNIGSLVPNAGVNNDLQYQHINGQTHYKKKEGHHLKSIEQKHSYNF